MPESVPLRTPPLTPESRSRTPRSTAAFDDTITIGSKAAVEADRVRLAANAAAKEAAANAERLVADAAIEAERASFGQCRRWQKASRAGFLARGGASEVGGRRQLWRPHTTTTTTTTTTTITTTTTTTRAGWPGGG